MKQVILVLACFSSLNQLATDYKRGNATLVDLGRLAKIYKLTEYANWEFTSNYAGHRIKDATKVITTEVSYDYIDGFWFVDESTTTTIVTTEYEVISPKQIIDPVIVPDPNTPIPAMTLEEVLAGIDPNETQLIDLLKGLK